MRTSDRIEAMGRSGLNCSQILATLALDLRGEDNPQLVGAMSGLAGGLGFTGGTCGCLTAGACVLGMYAGAQSADENDDERLLLLVSELVDWFDERYGARAGGTRCDQLLAAFPGGTATVCPALIGDTFAKLKELLVEEGFELDGGR